jgi:hypothetical protein
LVGFDAGALATFFKAGLAADLAATFFSGFGAALGADVRALAAAFAAALTVATFLGAGLGFAAERVAGLPAALLALGLAGLDLEVVLEGRGLGMGKDQQGGGVPPKACRARTARSPRNLRWSPDPDGRFRRTSEQECLIVGKAERRYKVRKSMGLGEVRVACRGANWTIPLGRCDRGIAEKRSHLWRPAGWRST